MVRVQFIMYRINLLLVNAIPVYGGYFRVHVFRFSGLLAKHRQVQLTVAGVVDARLVDVSATHGHLLVLVSLELLVEGVL